MVIEQGGEWIDCIDANKQNLNGHLNDLNSNWNLIDLNYQRALWAACFHFVGFTPGFGPAFLSLFIWHLTVATVPSRWGIEKSRPNVWLLWVVHETWLATVCYFCLLQKYYRSIIVPYTVVHAHVQFHMCTPCIALKVSWLWSMFIQASYPWAWNSIYWKYHVFGCRNSKM